jgi:hypothetical protein
MDRRHMRLKRLLVVTLFLLVIAVVNVRAGDLCNDKADPALFSLKNWNDLSLWYENYSECDDGYFAEGLSDFVVVSLAKRWKDMPSLQIEITKNREFKDFVLKHIDTTTDSNDLRTIGRNVKTKCPVNLHPLCKEIGKYTLVILNEMKEIKK